MVSGFQSPTKIAPDKIPMKSEENTSLVISARPIAIIGGKSAQIEQKILPVPPQDAQSGSKAQSQAVCAAPVATIAISPAIIASAAIARLSFFC